MCDTCATEYEELSNMLKDSKVKVEHKDGLVRGLDYYTGTVFEVTHNSLGSQDAIAAGGRYNDLVKQLGGPDVGATGYAIGIERLILAMDEKKEDGFCGVIVYPIADSGFKKSSEIVNMLRISGISCDTDYSGRSLKAVMRKANRQHKKFVVLTGGEEEKIGKYVLKNMETGEQLSLTFEELVSALKA